LAVLRQEGFTVAKVETWNAFARVSRDLFGFIDVLAIRADRPGVLGVQATTVSNQAARLTKALSIPELQTWLAAGNGFEVWGWKKARRSQRWECVRRPLTMHDTRG
jgi:hypothetical protein